ncbi:pleckstrin homology domain-containing family B member 2 [Octodon degus]|uniref:Pleckstrin homology domain-containing family B member 2 n=1 Tax=Octodon degus TaxID=10160 RepID=A0A6P6ERD0_OCTDE|nr:pleckstrin homology domain-containing family B member 2 [Octodon degus]
MMIRHDRVLRIKSICQWTASISAQGTSVGACVGSAVLSEETAVASSPPPYMAYAAPTSEQAYGYSPYGAAYPTGTQIVYAANGQTYAVPCQYPYAGLYGQQPANQVIIRERYRDNDSDLALGMLAGAATGMALGSLFWVF